jgi:hypothetical protein
VFLGDIVELATAVFVGRAHSPGGHPPAQSEQAESRPPERLRERDKPTQRTAVHLYL